MLLCGVDFETNGLDLSNSLITEVGAVIWDTEHSAPVAILNKLVRHAEFVLPPEIIKLTGITYELIQDYGEPPEKVFEELHSFIKSCNYVVAHNGALFDKPMLEAEMKRQGKELVKKPWIDTTTDVPFPEEMQTRKLVYLAAEHGFVNPFAHRALFDVLTMLKVLEKYKLADVCRLASEPTITIKAVVSYEDRDKAKARGFRWDGQNKQWIKSLKQSQLEKETVQTSFKVVQLT